MRHDRELVRALLRDQHPDLAELELRDVTGGWDNQMWRLGADLAVRMPRTERAPDLLRKEQQWLPRLAPQLNLPTPVPMRVGTPSARFAHPWTVVRWVEGEPADRAPINSLSSARTLAEFLTRLHHRAPADAPSNPYRGVPLADLGDVGDWFSVLDGHEHADAARIVWQRALAAQEWAGAPMWVHTDLHPANIVVRDGRLAGVIDFGDLCAGDPATDLAAAWLLLPSGGVDEFFAAYPTDEATRVRARGWAVLRALNLLEIGRNGRLGRPGGKPTWEPAGHAALARAVAAG